MADLDVQPKKKSKSILPWILLALGVLALIIFLARGCNDDNNTDTIGAAPDSTSGTQNTSPDTSTASAGNWWDNIDMNAPAANYDEITNKDISVRGNNNYGIYAIGEAVLFDEGKSTIRPQATSNLKQIVASINKRYNNGNIRIYGYTDSVGSTGANKQLAEQRTEAVKNWLTQSGNIPAGNLTTHPIGEGQPQASNASEQGRKQNRRVEIVVSNAGGTGAPSGSGGTGGSPHGDTTAGRNGSTSAASGDSTAARH